MVIAHSGICMWGATDVAPFFTAVGKYAYKMVR